MMMMMMVFVPWFLPSQHPMDIIIADGNIKSNRGLVILGNIDGLGNEVAIIRDKVGD